MPAKKPATRESPALRALAWNDAVRDILYSDGKLLLGDERTGDAVWEWDGVTWRRVPLVDRPVDVQREEDLAVAG
ncbi:MAG TPA: hypothetical protein VF997_07680 [Polyangia bacterium]